MSWVFIALKVINVGEKRYPIITNGGRTEEEKVLGKWPEILDYFYKFTGVLVT